MVVCLYTRAIMRSHILLKTLAWSRTSSLKIISADSGGNAFNVRNEPPNWDIPASNDTLVLSDGLSHTVTRT